MRRKCCQKTSPSSPSPGVAAGGGRGSPQLTTDVAIQRQAPTQQTPPLLQARQGIPKAQRRGAASQPPWRKGGTRRSRTEPTKEPQLPGQENTAHGSRTLARPQRATKKEQAGSIPLRSRWQGEKRKREEFSPLSKDGASAKSREVAPEDHAIKGTGSRFKLKQESIHTA